MFEIFVIPLLRRLMIFFFKVKSIRAHVRYKAFATLQIELYCIVNYDSKWSTKIHMDCMFEIFVISLLRRLMIIFYLKKSIKAHVQYRAFTTLQIELYCIMNSDRNWSTKFHKNCKFEIFVISLLRRLMIIFKHF